MRKRLFGLIALMMLCDVIMAQDCQIRFRGVILDKATKEPLEYTSVIIMETQAHQLADNLGRFEFTDICAGTYHVALHHIGCDKAEYFLRITRDTFFKFQLEHHAELLREIHIEGRAGSFNETQSKQTIGTSVLKESVGHSISKIVSQVTGVRMISNGAGISKPIIHGLFGNRVAMINNGLLQAGQQWGVDHAPELDPNAAGQITVIKGSDAIAYGAQALGGAILVNAGPISQDPHFHGYAGYNFASNGLAHTLFAKASQSLERFDWRGSLSFKKAGDHRTPDYFLTNTGLTEIGGSLQLAKKTGSNTHHDFYYSYFHTSPGIFIGAHHENLTELEEAIGREVPFNIDDAFSYTVNPPRQKVDHHLGKYAGQRIYDSDKIWSWLYGLQYNHRREFDIRRGNRSHIPALDLQLWNQTFETKWEDYSHSLRYRIGFQGRLTNNLNDAETGIFPLIPDYKEASGGLFATFQRPFQDWTMEGGTRYDFRFLRAWAFTMTQPVELVIRDHQFHEAAVSAGLVFQPNQTWITRFHAMYVGRSPAANELYSQGLHQGIAGIEEGTWELVQEYSYKTTLEQTLTFSHHLRIEAHIYSHWIQDFIYLQPQPELRLTIRGAFPVYRYAQENAWIRGMDMRMVADFGHRLEWIWKASMLRGTRNVEDLNLSNMPPFNTSSAFTWIFTDGKKWKSSRLHLDIEYVAQQNHWDEDAEFLAPPDDYFLLNAGMETALHVGKRIWYFSLSTENVLNARYQNYLNRLRYFADEEGIGVRLLIRYEF